MISVSKSVFRICTIFHQLFNVQKVETENILLLECMILGGLFTLDRTPSPQQPSYFPRQNVFEHTLIQLVGEGHLILEFLPYCSQRIFSIWKFSERFAQCSLRGWKLFLTWLARFFPSLPNVSLMDEIYILGEHPWKRQRAMSIWSCYSYYWHLEDISATLVLLF